MAEDYLSVTRELSQVEQEEEEPEDAVPDDEGEAPMPVSTEAAAKGKGWGSQAAAGETGGNLTEKEGRATGRDRSLSLAPSPGGVGYPCIKHTLPVSIASYKLVWGDSKSLVGRLGTNWRCVRLLQKNTTSLCSHLQLTSLPASE